MVLNINHDQKKACLKLIAILIVFGGCKANLDVIESRVKPQMIKYEVLEQHGVVKLKCNILKNLFKGIMSVNEIRWQSRKCGYGLNTTICGNYRNTTWTSVMCKNGSKVCDGSTIKIENPTSKDSGYYRCLYKNYMSKQFKVHRLFYLDVYDSLESIEILQEPAEYDNQIVHTNETVTFRCRARSLSPLHVLWMKLVKKNHLKSGVRLMKYDNENYELISTQVAYSIGRDLHISKLKLPNCGVRDSGYYYCIVISLNNARLFKNKSLSLTVIPRLKNEGFKAFSNIKLLLIIWIYILSTVSQISV